jgi:hypothetical protein
MGSLVNPELWGFKSRWNSARSTCFARILQSPVTGTYVSYSKSSLAETLNLEADSQAHAGGTPEPFFRFACS